MSLHIHHQLAPPHINQSTVSHNHYWKTEPWPAKNLIKFPLGSDCCENYQQSKMVWSVNDGWPDAAQRKSNGNLPASLQSVAEFSHSSHTISGTWTSKTLYNSLLYTLKLCYRTGTCGVCPVQVRRHNGWWVGNTNMYDMHSSSAKQGMKSARVVPITLCDLAISTSQALLCICH